MIMLLMCGEDILMYLNINQKTAVSEIHIFVIFMIISGTDFMLAVVDGKVNLW